MNTMPSDYRSDALPRYSVAELNRAIGSLLERGFAPRFLLDATVGRPQLKKGHLWLTLSDGEATITGVAWASQLPRLSYQPQDGDGVLVVSGSIPSPTTAFSASATSAAQRSSYSARGA